MTNEGTNNLRKSQGSRKTRGRKNVPPGFNRKNKRELEGKVEALQKRGTTKRTASNTMKVEPCANTVQGQRGKEQLKPNLGREN